MKLLKQWYEQNFNNCTPFEELSKEDINKYQNTISFAFFKLNNAVENLKKAFDKFRSSEEGRKLQNLAKKINQTK